MELKSELIGFRKLEGAHSGVNLGKVYVQILREAGILHKVRSDMNSYRVDSNSTAQ